MQRQLSAASPCAMYGSSPSARAIQSSGAGSRTGNRESRKGNPSCMHCPTRHNTHLHRQAIQPWTVSQLVSQASSCIQIACADAVRLSPAAANVQPSQYMCGGPSQQYDAALTCSSRTLADDLVLSAHLVAHPDCGTTNEIRPKGELGRPGKAFLERHASSIGESTPRLDPSKFLHGYRRQSLTIAQSYRTYPLHRMRLQNHVQEAPEAKSVETVVA